jgi:hypothetical protein
MSMKKLKVLLILNRKKYVSGFAVVFIIGLLFNLLFKKSPFSFEGFIPMLVIFSITVFKDYRSLE